MAVSPVNNMKPHDRLSHALRRLQQNKAVFKISRPLPSAPSPQRPRRESSLRIISQQILKHYAGKSEGEIRLNKFAQALGVERRRIYDIVNILEGFDIVEKLKKNTYRWRGFLLFQMKLQFLHSKPLSCPSRNTRLFSFEKKQKTSKKKSLTFLSISFLKKYYKKGQSFTFKQVVMDFFTHPLMGENDF